MEALKGFQKKFLKGRAHGLKPVVFLGQKGLTDNLIDSIHEALDTHELVKVKFIEFKEKFSDFFLFHRKALRKLSNFGKKA